MDFKDWTPGSIWREASANWLSGSSRSQISMATVIVLTIATQLAAAYDIARVQALEERQIERGFNLLVVSPDEAGSGAVGWQSCVQLERLAGVVAAGPVWKSGAQTLNGVGPDRQVMVVSPSAFSAITRSAADGNAEISISQELAEELNLLTGDLAVWIGSPSDSYSVASLPRSASSVTVFVNSITVIGLANQEDWTCYVRSRLNAIDQVAQVVPSLLVGPTVWEVVRVAQPTEGDEVPSEAFSRRPSLWIAPVSGASISIIWLVLVALSRPELGLYRSLGCSRIEGGLLMWFEGAISVLAGVFIATTVTIPWLVGIGNNVVVLGVVQASVRLLILSLVVPLVGLPFVVPRFAMSTLKDL